MDEECEDRRRERRWAERERKKAMGACPELAGIDTGAWDEIFEVFGGGAGCEDLDGYEQPAKPEMFYQGVSIYVRISFVV